MWRQATLQHRCNSTGKTRTLPGAEPGLHYHAGGRGAMSGRCARAPDFKAFSGPSMGFAELALMGFAAQEKVIGAMMVGSAVHPAGLTDNRRIRLVVTSVDVRRRKASGTGRQLDEWTWFVARAQMRRRRGLLIYGATAVERNGRHRPRLMVQHPAADVATASPKRKDGWPGRNCCANGRRAGWSPQPPASRRNRRATCG